MHSPYTSVIIFEVAYDIIQEMKMHLPATSQKEYLSARGHNMSSESCLTSDISIL